MDIRDRNIGGWARVVRRSEFFNERRIANRERVVTSEECRGGAAGVTA